MWWAGTNPVHVYLGQTRAAISVPGRPTAWTKQDSASSGWRWVVDQLAAELSSSKRLGGARIWLSGGLARPFVLPALSGVRTIDEAQTIAARMAPDQTGLQGASAVSLDGWTKDEPCLATAMEVELRELLLARNLNRGVRAVAIRPWWASVVNAIAESEADVGLVGVREPDALTVVGGRGTSLDLACNYAAMEVPAAAQVLARLSVATADLGQLNLCSLADGIGTVGEAQTHTESASRFAWVKEAWQ